MATTILIALAIIFCAFIVLAGLFFVGLWSADQKYPGTVNKFIKYCEQRRDACNKQVSDGLDALTQE